MYYLYMKCLYLGEQQKRNETAICCPWLAMLPATGWEKGNRGNPGSGVSTFSESQLFHVYHGLSFSSFF